MPSNLPSVLRLFLPLLLILLCSTPSSRAQPRMPEPRRGWADSYSANGRCYCLSNFDHGIGGKRVRTPKGLLTVREVCRALGPGPGARGRPLYNDVQCGHGPPNDAPDERQCPGRVDRGRAGCMQRGPRWDLGVLERAKKEKGGRVGGGALASSRGDGSEYVGLLPAVAAAGERGKAPGRVQAEDFERRRGGVRRQATADVGGGENIGYIMNGNYVEYPVRVRESGIYRAVFRVASQGGGGRIVVSVDRKQMASFGVKKTGGWQNWYSHVEHFGMNAGSRRLTLRFVGRKGYLLNVNWIDFRKT